MLSKDEEGVARIETAGIENTCNKVSFVDSSGQTYEIRGSGERGTGGLEKAPPCRGSQGSGARPKPRTLERYKLEIEKIKAVFNIMRQRSF